MHCVIDLWPHCGASASVLRSSFLYNIVMFSVDVVDAELWMCGVCRVITVKRDTELSVRHHSD